MDLPFAQKRWCGAFGVDKVKMLSDHKDGSFGSGYGTLIPDLRIETRDIRAGRKQQKWYTPSTLEVADHPNYEVALAAARAPGLPPERHKPSKFEVFLSQRPHRRRSRPADCRAVDSPLVRGAHAGGGVVTGNIVGFARVALTAHLLGTQSRADSLAVAMGPIDTLNSVLINSIVFAFVPCSRRARPGAIALFRKLARGFLWISSAIALAVMLAAPWLMRALAPGLDPGTSTSR